MTFTKAGLWAGTALALTGGFLILSGFGRGDRHFNPEKLDKFITFRINDTLDDVQATSDQRTQILAIKDHLLPDFIQAHSDRQAFRQAMVTQWKSDSPDAKAIHAAIDAEFDRRKALADETADALLQVHGILTADQRAQLGGRLVEGPFMQGMMR